MLLYHLYKAYITIFSTISLPLEVPLTLQALLLAPGVSRPRSAGMNMCSLKEVLMEPEDGYSEVRGYCKRGYMYPKLGKVITAECSSYKAIT